MTRDGTAASVHYVGFAQSAAQIDRFADEPVALAVRHPAYSEAARLSGDTKASLLDALRG